MLARMESGVATVVREPIDLVAIVHDVVEDAAFEAKSRGRAVEITETCDARVSGDPELLHSAVENVVRNSVRHTREGTAEQQLGIARHAGDPELQHSAVEDVVRNSVRHTREGTAAEV